MTEQQLLFLEYLEEFDGSVKKASEAAGISLAYGYDLTKKLKDEIVDRARTKLATASIKAASTTVDMMSADASTEKGELRLAAAEKVMDRVGLTRHTSVEVQVESTNGLFILPAKAPVAPESDSEELSDPE